MRDIIQLEVLDHQSKLQQAPKQHSVSLNKQDQKMDVL